MEAKAKAEAVSTQKSKILGWYSVYDIVLSKGWADDSSVAPAIAAWEFDFELAVQFIGRMNITEAW